MHSEPLLFNGDVFDSNRLTVAVINFLRLRIDCLFTRSDTAEISCCCRLVVYGTFRNITQPPLYNILELRRQKSIDEYPNG